MNFASLTADSDEKFRELLQTTSDLLFECGITKPAVMMTLDDKKSIISSVSLHYSILVSLAELEQLKKGLQQTVSFDKLMEDCGASLKPLFLNFPPKD